MKRLLAIFMSCLMVLTGCSVAKGKDEPVNNDKQEGSFKSISDPELLIYMEDTIYQELITTLDSEEYFVENIEATYYSKEYLEELEYNSKENIYFGYTLSDLNELFQGERYVFTLGEDGKTTVTAFEEYDNTYDKALLNVATGAGLILVCVTVSIATGGSAPAVSLIFAASAKSGTAMALSSGLFSTVTAGVVTGVQTKDVEKTVKSMALAGSEGFKWGAFSGVLTGGITETVALKGVTMNGLTMNQAAQIQKDSKLPLEFIKNFHSLDEYQVYKNAGLQISKVNGKFAYTQKVDWDFVGDVEDGRTNAQRVLDGLSPLDSTGKAYEIHHIGQKADSPFAILTNKQHHGNYSTIHANTGAESSLIDRNAFNKERIQFWKDFYEMTKGVK